MTDNGDGTYTLTRPANFNGDVTITYDVSDGRDNTTVSQAITFDAVNDAPVLDTLAALDDGVEDTPYTVRVIDLLEGYSDIEGENLELTNLRVTTNDGVGFIVTNNDNGTYTITPPTNYNGIVDLRYDVTDGVMSTEATQYFNLVGTNDAPDLTGEQDPVASLVAGFEDQSYQLDIALLTDGYSDIDGDDLSVENVDVDDGFTATLNEDGLSYTITAPLDYAGPVEIRYNVIDGNGGSISASQNFTLNPVADAPRLMSSRMLSDDVNPDITYTVNASDLLIGFADVDAGDSLRIRADSIIIEEGFSHEFDDALGIITITVPAEYLENEIHIAYQVEDSTYW
ncbi:MAG: tandem-95 repeat protein [Gammaproteobacteria bacterium]|nr:tandem-95 repeat protein [Gammaproteobacteria bacterium]